MTKKIVILGGSITGISAAYHLSKSGIKDYLLFEKENKIGGLCRTVHAASSGNKGDFLFDYTGHLLHLKTNYVQKMLGSFLKKHFNCHKRKAFIFYKGNYIPYPFQVNLKYLPYDAMQECLTEAIESWAGYKPLNEFGNFYDWIIAHFGHGISRHFMVPYNSKVFLTHPVNITCDWLSKFIPDVNLEEIFGNFHNSSCKEYGYNTSFYYPKSGGIEKLFDFFLPQLSGIHCGREVKEIDLKCRKIYFKNEEAVNYDILISTIPLKELIKLIYGLPDSIRKKEKLLKYSSVLNINLGVKGNIKENKHWIYFPEKKYSFYRAGFPSGLSVKMAPKGAFSVSTEIAYSGSINKTEVRQKVTKDLIDLKIVKNKSSILTENTLDIKYGYVLFDKNRKTAVNDVLEFLNRHKIHSIGRYGAWEYSYMEQNILAGKNIVELIASAEGGSASGGKG